MPSGFNKIHDTHSSMDRKNSH